MKNLLTLMAAGAIAVGNLMADDVEDLASQIYDLEQKVSKLEDKLDDREPRLRGAYFEPDPQDPHRYETHETIMETVEGRAKRILAEFNASVADGTVEIRKALPAK